jgi:hypothetical protein
MTKTELPPLPKPQSTVLIAHTERGITTTTWRTPGWAYFEAEQVRAYARTALAPLEAELERMRMDAARLAYVRDNFIGADFDWGSCDESGVTGRPVLLIAFTGKDVWGDFDLTIDSAMNTKGESA